MSVVTTTEYHSAPRGRVSDFMGSLLAALCIGVALLMDYFLGWGEGQQSVLNPAVAQVMLPILVAWIALAVIERAGGLSSIPLLLAHCAVALAPALAFGFLAQRGQLLSTWLGAQLPVGVVLTETTVSQGLVIFSLLLAAIACSHAVGLWFRSRAR